MSVSKRMADYSIYGPPPDRPERAYDRIRRRLVERARREYDRGLKRDAERADRKEAREEREAIRSEALESDRDRQLAIDRTNRLPADDPSFLGRSSPLSLARTVEINRRTLADLRAGRISDWMAARRAEPERPEPPGFHGVHTGWYRLGDCYYRIGSGPWPEYRPPGLAWKTRWSDPKPDDVPWEDEAAEATGPKLLDAETAALVKDRRTREPTGLRAPAGNADQLLFGFG